MLLRPSAAFAHSLSQHTSPTTRDLPNIQVVFLNRGILHLVSQVSCHLFIAQQNHEERLKKRLHNVVPKLDDVGALTSIYQRNLVTMTGASCNQPC